MKTGRAYHDVSVSKMVKTHAAMDVVWGPSERGSVEFGKACSSWADIADKV